MLRQISYGRWASCAGASAGSRHVVCQGPPIIPSNYTRLVAKCGQHISQTNLSAWALLNTTLQKITTIPQRTITLTVTVLVVWPEAVEAAVVWMARNLQTCFGQQKDDIFYTKAPSCTTNARGSWHSSVDLGSAYSSSRPAQKALFPVTEVFKYTNVR